MRVLAIVAAVLAAPVAWLATASLLFVWVLGFWRVYPWPDRLWMWARYAIEAPPNTIVHRWLVISGIVAALPLVLIGCLIISPGSKRGSLPVYGNSDWATGQQMKSGGISSDRRPF